jgi:hypothetical protein
MKTVYKAYIRQEHKLFEGEVMYMPVKGYYLEEIPYGSLYTPFESKEDLLQEIKCHKKNLSGYDIVILEELYIPYDWQEKL